MTRRSRSLSRRDRSRPRRHRSRTRTEWIASLKYNIQDATEALQAAVSMRNWAGVMKYARQLEALERKLFAAESSPTRGQRVAEVMGAERVRRYNAAMREESAETQAERRLRLRARGWQFGK